MTVETFDLPDVGEGVAEGELLRWLVAPGDAVEEDQPLAQVETDKAVVDLPSPYAGIVAERHAAEGEMVPVGSPIVSIEVDGAGTDAGEVDGEGGGAGETGDGGATTATGDDRPAADDGVAAANADDAADAAGSGRRVVAPPRTRRLARELGVDLDRVEGSEPGGRITDADVRAEADDGDGPAPRTRSAAATSVPREREGGDATAHREPAGAVDDATAAVDDAGAAETIGDATAAGASEGDASRDRTLAAPATRRLAADLGVDLDAVPTDERRDGVAFVTPAAVRDFAERRAADESGGATAASDDEAPAASELAVGGREPRPGDRIPYRGIRRSIGEQMERSKFTAPHATHTDEVDVTALVETKADLEAYAAESGVDLTYLPFVMRAVARALAEFPRVNASLDVEREEIRCHDEYNLGVATATEAGLLVPVVEDVDEKDLLDLAAETAAKVERARDRSIAREEMQGGTFTITNVGVIGGEYATPVVNHPEVAILALGRIAERPRVVDGEVVARHTLPLSLSVDHRVVDGAVAARFTNRVMELLASPARLLVE